MYNTVYANYTWYFEEITISTTVIIYSPIDYKNSNIWHNISGETFETHFLKRLFIF